MSLRSRSGEGDQPLGLVNYWAVLPPSTRYDRTRDERRLIGREKDRSGGPLRVSLHG